MDWSAGTAGCSVVLHLSLWISASPKPTCAQAPLRASCCTKNHVIWPRTEQVMAFPMIWHRACAMCNVHAPPRGVHQASKPCPAAFSSPFTLDVRAAAVWGSSTLSKVVVLTCKKMHTSRIGGCMCCSAPPRPLLPPMQPGACNERVARMQGTC